MMWCQKVCGGETRYTAADDGNTLRVDRASIKQYFNSGLLVKFFTFRKRNWIKNDPGSLSALNGVMLPSIFDMNPIDRHPVARLQMDAADMAQPSPELSPQTTWMLAVRDDRDRAALVALFDHFAPRL
jgi:hypothetical protein